MRRSWWLLLLFGLLLSGLAFWQILASTQGLRVVALNAAGTPVTAFLAQKGQAANAPVILIGHGFAGSGTVMRGFALTLAHAGYNAITWDFAGHGANPGSLSGSDQRDALVGDAERALTEARQQGLVEGGQVAILGHSMGSGVALTYGQLHPDTDATIAVSPVERQVTPELPRNLLLMAGTQEASFLETARRLLAQAGGEGGDLHQGTARQLVEIPGANHLTILFSSRAYQAVLNWVNNVFGVQAGASTYPDHRMAWFSIGLAGALLTAIGLALHLRLEVKIAPVGSVLQRLAAILFGALLAVFILWLLGQAGFETTSLFGLLVGGYLMVWFALAGVAGLLVLRLWPADVSLHTSLAGVLTFAVMWVGIGLLSHFVWQPWLMIPTRLVLWPLAVICLLPWFILLGELVRGQGWLGQLASWLAHSLILLGGIFLAMQITPGIGFLILIMPVFPLFFGLHALAAAPFRGGWPFALSGALFTAWMLLVVFPLG